VVVRRCARLFLLCLFNSAMMTEYIKRFANDLRQVPIIVPTSVQRKYFSKLARWAMEAKQCKFTN
jgi:hypothetical protein